ncbi:MAG: pyruvate kinase, partial [Deltaproteobacteria bacterium]|nr:pyruvate kinase [Deltaproteobacteria bacterium]
MRRTKIVCTIGPTSSSEKTLKALIQAGMNVARLNFSHGDYSFHSRIIRTIRRLERQLETPVAILQDLPGPKIRIGAVGGDRVRLQTRRPFVLTTRKIIGSELAVSVSFPGLAKVVKKGDPILLGDGEIELEATQVSKKEVKCRIVVGGILGSHKGIHFPHGSLNVRALTNRDKKDLVFGIEKKVDMIALSFVRTSNDIRYARRELQARKSIIPLIAKMEKHEAVENIDTILEAVDGIMVARGDLGLEIDQERIPTVQKMMIRKANHIGKPVITATQMLRSMVWNPRPTRAEVTDIANAVLDGTDALMLSEETAAGEYPVEAVKIMAQVAEETEKILEPRQRFVGLQRTVPEAIGLGAIAMARDLHVKAFLIPTSSGTMARLVARYRPQQPIVAISPNLQTIKFMCL